MGGTTRAGGGTRTHDLTITSRLRYQLRHTGLAQGYLAAGPCSVLREDVRAPAGVWPKASAVLALLARRWEAAPMGNGWPTGDGLDAVLTGKAG